MRISFSDLPDDNIINEVQEYLEEKIGEDHKISKSGKDLVVEGENVSTQNVKSWVKRGLQKFGVRRNSKVISLGNGEFNIFYKEEY